MGTATAFVPSTAPTAAGTTSEPEKVVAEVPRLEASQPAGEVTAMMLIEVTVMGTDSGLATLYQRYSVVPGMSSAATWLVDELLIVLVIVKSAPAVSSNLGL